MSKELQNNIKIIDKNFDFIKKSYNVKNIGFFGSFARGQNKKGSDIDMIIEFSKPVGFFQFVQLEDFLSNILNGQVDLVTKNGLKPAIKESVLKETIYV